MQHEFDLKSQVWFQTKIAQHKVQLPLYYTHFEITQFFLSNINIYLSTSGNLTFEEAGEFGEQKLQNLPPKWIFLPYIFLQSDWLVQVSHHIWSWLVLFHIHFEGLKKDAI